MFLVDCRGFIKSIQKVEANIKKFSIFVVASRFLRASYLGVSGIPFKLTRRTSLGIEKSPDPLLNHFEWALSDYQASSRLCINILE